MKNCLKFALLLAFAAPLSACGISGGLKTPPPLWGETTAAKTADDAAVEAAEAALDAASTTSSDTPFNSNNSDGVGYGVDVADTP